MWWFLLLCLISLADCNKSQEPPAMEIYSQEELHIQNCRSPNMVEFTCWWNPLRNISDEDSPTYILNYTIDREPELQCPDYTSKGPNSCYFNKSHTLVWKMYCMSVTAVTARGNFTSRKHCLDVANIVQTEAPVGLTYNLEEAGGDERGYNVLLSWAYPIPADLQHGWITLLYELQYRRLSEPDNWNVKEAQKEAHVKLQGLPAEDYVARVRCRSQNGGIWSRWSSTLHMTFPAKPPTGQLFVLILGTGFGVVTLLMIGFGVIQHNKRMKAYILPTIPKPRIMGIDPLLLKKGCMSEIDNHFSSFHGYSDPVYVEEVWHHVSCPDPPPEGVGLPTGLREMLLGEKAVEEMLLREKAVEDMLLREKGVAEMLLREKAVEDMLLREKAVAEVLLREKAVEDMLLEEKRVAVGPPPMSEVTQLPASSYVLAPPPAPAPWAWLDVTLLPGTDYSTVVHPSPPRPSPKDFYTCVLTNSRGEVHLVPCLTPAPTPHSPHLQAEGGADTSDGTVELADHLPGKSYIVLAATTADATDRGKVRNGEEDTPLLLPVALATTAEQ